MRTVALATFVILCVGCSGMSLPGTAVGALPNDVSMHSTTVTFTLPPILAPGTVALPSVPGALSSSTASVAGTIGATRFGPVALNSSNPDCRAGTGGLTCTVVVTAVPGRHEKIRIFTYASSTAQPLATARFTHNIYTGLNTLAIPLYGIARAIGVEPTIETLNQGQWLRDQILAYGIDASGNPIPSRAVRTPGGSYISVDLTWSGFYNGVGSGGGYGNVCCGPIGVFPYDGLHTGAESVTVHAAAYGQSGLSYPPSTYTFSIGPSGQTFAPLTFFVFNSFPLDIYSVIGQFPSNAQGSTVPTRQFVDSFSTLYSGVAHPWPMFGEDPQGNFWLGNVHVSNTLNVLNQVILPSGAVASARDRAGNLYAATQRPCAILQFPANQYGTLNSTREIDGYCGAIVTDALGDVYLATSATNSKGQRVPAVKEFAYDSGSGSISPSRIMYLPQPKNYPRQITSFDVDAAGNVYALLDGGVYVFAPDSSNATPILKGVNAYALAVDDAGDIYVSDSHGGADTQVQMFPKNSSTPTQAIYDTSYEFGAPQRYAGPSIMVPRALTVP